MLVKSIQNVNKIIVHIPGLGCISINLEGYQTRNGTKRGTGARIKKKHRAHYQMACAPASFHRTNQGGHRCAGYRLQAADLAVSVAGYHHRNWDKDEEEAEAPYCRHVPPQAVITTPRSGGIPRRGHRWSPCRLNSMRWVPPPPDLEQRDAVGRGVEGKSTEQRMEGERKRWEQAGAPVTGG